VYGQISINELYGNGVSFAEMVGDSQSDPVVTISCFLMEELLSSLQVSVQIAYLYLRIVVCGQYAPLTLLSIWNASPRRTGDSFLHAHLQEC